MKLTFEKMGEITEINIMGHNLLFSCGHRQLATIDGLKLDYEGVIKEYPELKDAKDWRIKAIVRFKEKIKTLKGEKEVAKYLVEDLLKHHYKLINAQQDGFRATKNL